MNFSVIGWPSLLSMYSSNAVFAKSGGMTDRMPETSFLNIAVDICTVREGKKKRSKRANCLTFVVFTIIRGLEPPVRNRGKMHHESQVPRFVVTIEIAECAPDGTCNSSGLIRDAINLCRLRDIFPWGQKIIRLGNPIGIRDTKFPYAWELWLNNTQNTSTHTKLRQTRLPPLTPHSCVCVCVYIYITSRGYFIYASTSAHTSISVASHVGRRADTASMRMSIYFGMKTAYIFF